MNLKQWCAFYHRATRRPNGKGGYSSVLFFSVSPPFLWIPALLLSICHRSPFPWGPISPFTGDRSSQLVQLKEQLDFSERDATDLTIVSAVAHPWWNGWAMLFFTRFKVRGTEGWVREDNRSVSDQTLCHYVKRHFSSREDYNAISLQPLPSGSTEIETDQESLGFLFPPTFEGQLKTKI